MTIGKWIMAAVLLATLTTGAAAQEKGGEDISGPYEVVENWPQPLHTDGWSWGSTAGIWAETPDRVFVLQRGELPVLGPDATGLTSSLPARAATGGKARWEHLVMIFDGEGKLVDSWEQYNQMFVRPHRILMNPHDPERHVWVVDDRGHQIFKFTNDGSEIGLHLGEKGVPGNDKNHFDRPTDIAWLPNGDFYVTDGYNNTRVVKFSSEGEYLFEWGKPGTGPGEFNLVHGIVIDANRRIYVSDRSNSRIQVFDENGKYLEEWPNIKSPYFLRLSQDQHIWVSDGVTQKLLKYDLNGKFLDSWGTFGIFPGALWGPHQFSVDSDGNFYVAEVFNGRAQKFRPKSNADPEALVKQ